MSLALIKRLFGVRAPKEDAYKHPAEDQFPEHLIKDLKEGAWRQLKYPPFPEGFPARMRGCDLMMKLQPELVTRIRVSVGMNDANFDSLVEPVLINFAELVHLLPASENYHHSGPGGLIRHCIEVSNFTLDQCLTSSFDNNETPARRSARRIRWQVAGVFAGLLHDAGKALTDMTVMDFKGENQWVYAEGTIYDWSTKNDIPRYFIHWNKGRHENHKPESAALTAKIIPAHVEAWLCEYGRDIYTDMLKAVQGIPSKSRLTEFVISADSASVGLDMKRGSSGGGTSVQVTRMVTDTMIRLLSSGAWKVNEPGARVWVATDGVYIVWNSGVQDIVDALVIDGVTEIPRSPDTLIGILADSDLASRTPDGDLYWFVTPHLLRKNDKGPVLKCLKLKNPLLLFAHIGMPAPVSINLGREGHQTEILTPEDKKSVQPAEQQSRAMRGAMAPADQADQPKAQKKKSPPPTLPATPTPSIPNLVPIANHSPAEDEPEQATEDVEELDEFAGKDRDVSTEAMHKSLASAALKSPAPKLHAVKPDSVSNVAEQAEKAEFAARTGKVSLAEILAAPLPAAEDVQIPTTRGSILKTPAPVATLAPTFLLPPASSAQEVIPKAVESNLTDEEWLLLNQYPELAAKLVNACLRNNGLNLRVVYSKVFVPFYDLSDFVAEDIPALDAAGWVWHDYSAANRDGMTRTVNRRDGFVLSQDLSFIAYKLVPLLEGVSHVSLIPESELQGCKHFIDLAAKASTWTYNGDFEVFEISIYLQQKLAERAGITSELADLALVSMCDAIRNTESKRYVFRMKQSG